VVGVEQRVAVLHGGAVAAIRLQQIDQGFGFGFGRGLAHAAGQIGEGAEVVVDENLARDADLAGERLDVVGLLGLSHGAGLDFAMLIELFEHWRFAQHDLVHGAEVARRGLPAEAVDAHWRCLIGCPQRAADGVADDQTKVAGGV